MAADNSALHHRNKLQYKIYEIRKVIFKLQKDYCFYCVFTVDFFLLNDLKP